MNCFSMKGITGPTGPAGSSLISTGKFNLTFTSLTTPSIWSEGNITVSCSYTKVGDKVTITLGNGVNQSTTTSSSVISSINSIPTNLIPATGKNNIINVVPNSATAAITDSALLFLSGNDALSVPKGIIQVKPFNFEFGGNSSGLTGVPPTSIDYNLSI